MPKSILVSELTHSSLFLLQAKLMVSDKKKYSMNVIINKLMQFYDQEVQGLQPSTNILQPFKLENIEDYPLINKEEI